MVSKNLPVGIKIVIPVKHSYLKEYVKVRESLYICVVIWVNTILNHTDTGSLLPRYVGSCVVYRPERYWKQKYRPISIPY